MTGRAREIGKQTNKDMVISDERERERENVCRESSSEYSSSARLGRLWSGKLECLCPFDVGHREVKGERDLL